jgi:hypothetical protein
VVVNARQIPIEGVSPAAVMPLSGARGLDASVAGERISVFHGPATITLQEYRDTIDETERPIARLTDQLRQLAPTWRWAPEVAALQAHQ